jgi:hypothetical protein
MLPRSKSKRITVDGQRYQYVVSESGPVQAGVVPLAVTVQHGQNGARLRVLGITTLRVPADQSRFYLGRTASPNIEPRYVAQLIGLAVSRGWVPTLPGPIFLLHVTNLDIDLVTAEA